MRLLRLASLVLLAVGAASAQTLGRPPAAGPVVSFDALLAVGDDMPVTALNDQGELIEVATVGITATTFVLSGWMPVGGRWTAVAELPLAYYRRDIPSRGGGIATDAAVTNGGDVASDLALGNPYLGAELRLRPDVAVEAGVRLPLASTLEFDPRATEVQVDGAWGGTTANQEQFEAYLGRTASLAAAVRYTPQLTPALGLRLRLAPTVVMSTDRERDGRTDVGLGYGLHADARRGPLAASVGATGRQFVRGTSDGYGFFDADLALSLAASVDVGGVRPGLMARVPLADEILSGAATLGFSLDVLIR